MIFQFKLCPKQFNRRLGPNSKVSISADTNFIAFSDIDHNILLYNRAKNTVDLLAKKLRFIRSIVFCQDLVATVQDGSSQVCIFSAKSCKLKKVITPSTSKTICLGYSRDRKFLFTQSINNCILWKLPSLTKQKTLNCSTSNFIGSNFTRDGKYLVNFFDDSTVFFWDLNNYTYDQTSVPYIESPTAMNIGLGKYIIAGCESTLLVSNYVKDRTRFDEVATVQGQINKIDFAGQHLVIQSTHGLYMGSIYEDFKISALVELIMVGIKQFCVSGEYIASTNCVNDIIVSKASDMVSLNSQKVAKAKIYYNPLDNTGHYCAGGFDNRQGCDCNNRSLLPQHVLSSTDHYLQKMYKSILISNSDLKGFSKEKLSLFLLKRNRFVDKHRAVTYKYLLDLPLNISAFKNLVRLGINRQVSSLRLKYPIKNERLFTSFEFVMSLLSHYCSAFADVQYVAGLVFPIVLTFGQDELLCVQICIYFLTYWMYPLFQSYPAPNIDLIYSIQTIIQISKPSLISHFRQSKLPLSQLIWSVYSSFFSQVMNRNNYMSLVDTLVCFNESPQLIIFEVAAFIIYNSAALTNIKTRQQLDTFLQTQNNQDCDKLLRLVHNLHQKYKDQVEYKFKKPYIDLKGYRQFDICDTEALHAQRNRRIAQQRSYLQTQQQKQYQKERDDRNQRQMIKQKQDIDRNIIKMQLGRFRQNQFERRKQNKDFNQTQSSGKKKKLQLVEEQIQESKDHFRRTAENAPFSYLGNIFTNNVNKDCCQNQGKTNKSLQKTRI